MPANSILSNMAAKDFDIDSMVPGISIRIIKAGDSVAGKVIDTVVLDPATNSKTPGKNHSISIEAVPYSTPV